MDENIKKWVISTWLIKSYKLQFNEYLEIKKQRDTYARDVDMEYDPSNLVFAKWLASKFYNHLDMDWYTKNALWIYWARGYDEVELPDEDSSDPDDENPIDENEVAKFFRIETNVFDFKTPMCIAFKEFNCLLQIDPDVLTKDIDGFKTRHSKWPTCSWKDDGYCNGGNLPGAYTVGNTLRYQDLEWNNYTKTDEERCELLNDTTHELAIYKIRRFEIIKYSFEQGEVYVAIKECEYDDLTKTNEDACRAYQEIFRSMDEGWVVTRAE
ncbi:hypothetical protein Tco_0994870 [Tanacetum coccineum]